MRKTNLAGIDLIKRYEGLRLKAYQCSAGVWTIGYGHTKEVSEGMVISPATADAFLRDDLAVAESAVEKVKVALNDNEFSALVAFVFNVGVGAFTQSTLLKKLNAEQFDAAADEFLRWNKSGGKALKGLARRRAAERALFLSEIE
jgi:lysozyme